MAVIPPSRAVGLLGEWMAPYSVRSLTSGSREGTSPQETILPFRYKGVVDVWKSGHPSYAYKTTKRASGVRGAGGMPLYYIWLILSITGLVHHNV